MTEGPGTPHESDPQGWRQAPPAQVAPPYGRPHHPPPRYAPPHAPSPTDRSTGPDWNALAERNVATQKRGRLLRVACAVLGVLVIAGGGTYLAVSRHSSGHQHLTASSPAPSPASGVGSANGSADASPSADPSRPAPPTVLTPTVGGIPAVLGASARLGTVPGHTGSVLRLDGSESASASTTAPVVDVGKSFAVSAWIYNAAGTGSRSAMSQGSGSYYSFELGRDYWGTHNAWVFKAQTAAGNQDDTTYEAFSKADATVNQWVLLTGTYNERTRVISLYVDGAPASSTKVPGIWAAPGPLQIGRDRYHGIWTDPWQGYLADLQVWNQALSPTQVTGLARTPGGSGVRPVVAWLAK